MISVRSKPQWHENIIVIIMKIKHIEFEVQILLIKKLIKDNEKIKY